MTQTITPAPGHTVSTRARTPLKIAIVSLLLPSGSKIGVGYQVHFLANALVKRGHRVTVFSQTGKMVDSLYDVKVVEPRRRLRTFLFAWDLRRENFDGFDVINAHGDDWFLWGKRRPRHVHTYHGSLLAETLHAKGLLTKLRLGALALCEYNSLLLCDERVTVSKNTQRYIPGIPHVIPCGVDLDDFRPGEHREEKPTLLFVGTAHGRKRGDMLVDLFNTRIRTAVPDAQLWCVCDRPAHIPQSAGVTWFGRLSHEALVDLYRRAWVFCLPSTYEGFGVPYVEAMASGLPVVASPNVGAREVTGEGRFGHVVEDALLAPTIVRLLTDASERDKYIELGLTRSIDFGWHRVCEQYEAVYSPVSAGKERA
jgi:phosphatidyl-myo-inositol alpha-mannosyltransferase